MSTLDFRIILNSEIPDLAPEESLHIGDDLVTDYFGALDVGWQSWLVSPDYEDQCLKHGIHPDPNTMFENLADVIGALRDNNV